MKQDQPSATAGFVAGGVFWVSQHSRFKTEVPSGMAELNALLICPDSRSKRPLLRKAGIYQALSVPGIYLHFVLRKRHIEAQVRDAIEAGARQVVILGAGFDTLSLRLAAADNALTVIEMDHPATQRSKQKAFSRVLADHPNLQFLELDHSRQSLQATLLESAIYDPEQASVFVAEGLFMYLQETEVSEVFTFINSHSASGSCFVFTFMEEHQPGRFQFRNASPLTNLWLRLSGEAFTWGLPLDQLGPFVNEKGFQLKGLATHAELKQTLQPENRGAQLAQGECVATVLKS